MGSINSELKAEEKSMEKTRERASRWDGWCAGKIAERICVANRHIKTDQFQL